MTKQQIEKELRKAMFERKVANIYLLSEQSYYNFIPVSISNDLVFCIHEYDFETDGFAIIPLAEIDVIHIKNDMCDEILVKEGVLENIVIPAIEITNWRTVFTYLVGKNMNVLMQAYYSDDEELDFFLGRPMVVHEDHVSFLHYDADGIWEQKPYDIYYSEITILRIGSRYETTFSKYVGEPPMGE